MMKIVYCGFDLFKGCLDGLMDAGHQILAIYSFPTDHKHDSHAYVASVAEKHKIRFIVGPVRRKDLDEFADMGCELIVSAGYAYKIPPCEKIPYRINLHPAPLPYGRGAWPLECAILEGVREWAVTIHELSPEWDAGAILAQKTFDVAGDEKLESLSVKCQMAAKALMGEVVGDIKSFWENRVEQGEGVYWRMPTLDEMTIDWNWPVEKIDRHVRAFSKRGARAFVCGKAISVQDVVAWKESHTFGPGEIAWRTTNEVVIAAADGLVCLRFWNSVPETL